MPNIICYWRTQQDNGVYLSSPLQLMQEKCEQCPICGAPSSSYKEIEGNNVECTGCGSQWHFDFESGEPMVSLTKAGKDDFRIWLYEKEPIDFWENLRARRIADAFEYGTRKWRPVQMVTAFTGGLLFAFGILSGGFTIQTWQGKILVEETRPYIGYSYPLMILGITIAIIGVASVAISGLRARQRARSFRD